MNLNTAIEKLDQLTAPELEHCIQLSTVEIDNYTFAICNYPPRRMKLFAKPHMKRLLDRRARFEKRLRELQSL